MVPAAPASGSIFAYVTNAGGGGNPGSLTQYDASSGGLSWLSPPRVAVADSPIGVAVSPDRRNVYATTTPFGPTSGSLLHYVIGPNGALSLQSSAPVPPGALPGSLVVSPDGRSVYAVNNGGMRPLIQYSVKADGDLALKSPATVPAGHAPQRLAISSNGRSLYVTDGNKTIWQYSVGDDGALSPKSPPTVATTKFPNGIAVSPDSRSVYVAEYGAFGRRGNVSQYTVRGDGTLTPKSPAAVDARGNPVEVAVRPDGRSVYMTDSAPTKPTGGVFQYSVGPDGTLAPMAPEEVSAGSSPLGIAVHPDGEAVYAANAASHTISQYSVSPDGGLRSRSRAEIRSGHNPIEIAVRPLAARITGGPNGTTSDPTPTFRFAAFGPNANFRCKVDARDYRVCSSPDTLSRLADGSHSFSVRTTTDSTPDRRTFKVVSSPRIPG